MSFAAMNVRVKTKRWLEPTTGELCFAPVNRARLARYLELPSVGEIDEVTDAEIDKLDRERDTLLEFNKRALAVPIDRIDGACVELEDGTRLQTTVAFGRQLARNGADWLIVSCFTLGGAVDARVQRHLEADEWFEAFVLKQWAATMTEQARAWLTLSLCGWADRQDRSLLPFSGPGYNGWPLQQMAALHAMLDDGGGGAARPVRVNDAGMLRPINSMMIVHGATPRRMTLAREETLAQCHRCAMRNCRYRVVPLDAQSEPEIAGTAC